MDYKDVLNKKGFIFDVDGTLYDQRSMRIKMLFRLIFFYIFHLRAVKELLAVYLFRKCREKEKYRTYSMEDLYSVVADRLNMKAEAVSFSIQKWMFGVPLEIIGESSYGEVIAFAKEMHQMGKKVIIYSDYPALEKLSALEMPYDHVFVSGKENLSELKPSRIAMEYILHDTGFSADDLMYIGDRNEKDGVSAKMVNISYCDIQNFRKILKNNTNTL